MESYRIGAHTSSAPSEQHYYYPGLEVAPPTDPEVVPGPPPEVVPSPAPEAAWPPHEKGWQPDANLPEATATRKPWYFNRRILIGIGVAVVCIIVAVVVGCVVGLNHTSNTTSSRANESIYKSACAGVVCPQILTAAAVGSPPSLFVFARGVDNSIWYNSANTSDLTTSWPSDKSWQNLGNGPYRSQPIAESWDYSTAVSVAAIADPAGTVQLRTFNATTASWNDTWDDLRGNPSSAVSMCTVDLQRLDLWAIEDDTVAHDFFDFDTEDFYSVVDSTDWQGTASFSSDLSARPAIVCRNTAYIHDLVVYSSNGSVLYTTWSGPTTWTPIYAPFADTEFQSDPVLLETNLERWDFFGIDTSGAMNHFSWQNKTGFSSLDKLGGSFESVPSAVVTGNGSRIDVAALGTNGTLLHRSLQVSSSSWSSAWEDLGVVANSAPLLINITGHGQPERIAAFVLGTGGEINQTTWTVSDETSWQGLDWSSMGGNMTSVYYGSS